jgi:hypothetical protein
MRTNSKNYIDDFPEDRLDPQIPERCFVALCEGLHGQIDSCNEVEAPEPDQSEMMAALGAILNNVLTRQEKRVLIQRILLGNTYAEIAEMCWPRLSGPSQARKIEHRALRKLRARLSRFRNDAKPMSDAPGS